MGLNLLQRSKCSKLKNLKYPQTRKLNSLMKFYKFKRKIKNYWLNYKKIMTKSQNNISKKEQKKIQLGERKIFNSYKQLKN